MVWRAMLRATIILLVVLALFMIAGGIPWLYPLEQGMVGVRWVPWSWWWPLDGICVLSVYLIHRVIPRYRRAGAMTAGRVTSPGRDSQEEPDSTAGPP